jgi:anti-sigma factor RsiW
MNLDDEALAQKIKQFGTRHAAPDHLRAGLRAQVALSSASRTEAPPPVTWGARLARGLVAVRGAGAAQGLAGFALGLLVMATVPSAYQRWASPGADDAEFVGNHVRALQIGPLYEVASSDRHTVKPWFQGKLDYAPPVLDLSPEPFPLLGGRIEHLQGQTVATLAYARNRHLIDLYVWPSTVHMAPVSSVQRGYNLVHWADGAMQYRVVSDLERRELERFTQLWRDRLAAQ